MPWMNNIADKWLVMIAVTLGMFLSVLESTIVNVAIPQLQQSFGADLAHIQWVTTIYMMTQAAVIPTAPYLERRLGTKRAYVWSLGAFVLGSVLCGFAWNLPSLIFFRLLQGIGGGTLLPMVMTLLYGAFPIKERGMAVSIMGVPLMFAPLLGPVLGGLLVTYASWPWVFFINLPIGLVALAIAQRVLKADAGSAGARFDGLGFFTIALGSAALLSGVAAASEGGGSPNFVLVALGVLGFVTFTWAELWRVRRGKAVLLDLRRFSDRAFTLSTVANALVFFIRFGILFLLPIYLQALRGQSAAQAGGLLTVQAVATLLALPLAGSAAKQYGSRAVALVGVTMLALSSGLLLTLSLTTPFWVVGVLIAVFGASSALTQQLPVTAMSRIARHESAEVSNGSTLLNVLQSAAAPLGVTTLSSLTQVRAAFHSTVLSAQGLAGSELSRQSTLLAMRESFALAAAFMLVAFVAMTFVPRLRGDPEEQEEPTALTAS